MPARSLTTTRAALTSRPARAARIPRAARVRGSCPDSPSVAGSIPLFQLEGRRDASRAGGRTAEPHLLEGDELDAAAVVEQLGEAGPVVVEALRGAAEPAIFEVHQIG